MKTIRQFLTICGTAALFASTGCTPTPTDDPTPTPTSNVVEIKDQNITANTTWTANKVYLLKGFNYVKSGATLTIEPGTIIKGDKDTKGSLFITTGAKIRAVGTAEKPIVFTSNKAKGQRAAGDWGGLIILGKAKVNKPNAVVEGENQTLFGGNDDADNSGELKYVRIEFAGIPLETDKEINGLTLGGVGNGTKIEYVQVSYSGDDAIEWFGGSVNAKHLVTYATLDDDFDTDNGYSGKVQYGLALRDPNIADQCACSKSNGFESDNDGTGSAALPQTSAQFANVSIFIAPGAVNAKYNAAAQIRRNSAQSIYNTVFVGMYPSGLDMTGADTTQYNTGAARMQGLTFVDMTTKFKSTPYNLFTNAANANDITATITALLLNSAYNMLGMPKFLPQTGSPLLTGGVALPTGFETTAYRGAFGTSDWTATWTNFDPQNTNY
jgi:hypothetical protein